MEKIKFRTVISETIKKYRSCNCINCYYGIYGIYGHRPINKKSITNVKPSYREVLNSNTL